MEMSSLLCFYLGELLRGGRENRRERRGGEGGAEEVLAFIRGRGEAAQGAGRRAQRCAAAAAWEGAGDGQGMEVAWERGSQGKDMGRQGT